MPKATALSWTHGACWVSAKPRVPPISIRTIPKTMWWMWRPPSVVTLPGHQGTRGLRIRRALVRMNRKETRKAAKRRRTDDWVDPEPWMLIPIAAMTAASSHAAIPLRLEIGLRTSRHERQPERPRRGFRGDQRARDRVALPGHHLAVRGRLDPRDPARLARDEGDQGIGGAPRRPGDRAGWRDRRLRRAGQPRDPGRVPTLLRAPHAADPGTRAVAGARPPRRLRRRRRGRRRSRCRAGRGRRPGGSRRDRRARRGRRIARSWTRTS